MIAYHGTPTGGTRVDTVRFLSGRHALIPYPRPDDLGVAMDVCQSFVVDNGAFTAWKQGETMDVEGYRAWVVSLCRHPAFDWCLVPDVIDGTEKENDELAKWWAGQHPHMESVPVWHLHDSLDRLEWLSGVYKRIALGSSGQWPTPGLASWWGRMGEAMAAVSDDGKPRCKLHGLRMLSPDVFRHLPLASADSTNAVRNANLVSRFGMYPPPALSQRMDAIAARIEAHQSAAVWVGGSVEPELWPAV